MKIVLFILSFLISITALADAPLDDELTQAMRLEGSIKKGKESI